MRAKTIVETSVVELTPDPSWSWGLGFNGEVSVTTTLPHPLKIDGKLVVLEADLIKSITDKVAGAKYTATSFNVPGSVASVQVQIALQTLVNAIRVNGQKTLSLMTEGFFMLVCGEPAKTPKGDPDIALIKNGTWKFKEAGQTSTVVVNDTTQKREKKTTPDQKINFAETVAVQKNQSTLSSGGELALSYCYDDPLHTAVSQIPYRLTYSDGRVHSGMLNNKGLADITDIPTGICIVEYQPDTDESKLNSEILEFKKKLQDALDQIINDQLAASKLNEQELEEESITGEILLYFYSPLEGVWDGIMDFKREIYDLVGLAADLLQFLWKLGLEVMDIWYCLITGDISELQKKTKAAYDTGKAVFKEVQNFYETLILILSDEELRSTFIDFPSRYWAALDTRSQVSLASRILTNLIIDIIVGILVVVATQGTASSVVVAVIIKRLETVSKPTKVAISYLRKLVDLLKKLRTRKKVLLKSNAKSKEVTSVLAKVRSQVENISYLSQIKTASRLDSILKPGTYRIDPSMVRFSQSTASPYWSKAIPGNKKTGQKAIIQVQDTINELRQGKKISKLPTINVVQYKGKLYTLGNRRLLAYKSSNLPEIPVEIVSLKKDDILREFLTKFDPIDGKGELIGLGLSDTKYKKKFGKYKKPSKEEYQNFQMAIQEELLTRKKIKGVKKNQIRLLQQF